MPRVPTNEEKDEVSAGFRPADPEQPADTERRSYYYDDAHGYEDFDPESEREDGDESGES